MVVITHRHVLSIENKTSGLIYKCDREKKLIVTANRKYKGKYKNEKYILRVC